MQRPVDISLAYIDAFIAHSSFKFPPLKEFRQNLTQSCATTMCKFRM